MLSAEERFNEEGFIPPWVKAEHLARYEFARPFVKEKIVVDCASGSGIGSRLYAEFGAKRVEAFDNNSRAISENENSFNLCFAVADALSLPVDNKSADVFISFETIEHLDDAHGFLAEIRRILKPDGIFICSTPNRLITNPGLPAGEAGSKISDRPWNKFHKREYSPEEFNALLKEFFPKIEWFGQNREAPVLSLFFSNLAGLFGVKAAVRARQFSKLPRLFLDNPGRHAVVPAAHIKDVESCEYMVVVGRI